jgi:hypothetical protein
MQSQVQRQFAADPAQAQWLAQFLQGQATYPFAQSSLSWILQLNVYHTWNDDHSHYFGAQAVTGFQLTWDLKKK